MEGTHMARRESSPLVDSRLYTEKSCKAKHRDSPVSQRFKAHIFVFGSLQQEDHAELVSQSHCPFESTSPFARDSAT